MSRDLFPYPQASRDLIGQPAVLWQKIGLNLNTTAEQVINQVFPWTQAQFMFTAAILACNSSANLSAFAGTLTITTGPGGTGTTLLAAQGLTGIGSATAASRYTLVSGSKRTEPALYCTLSSAFGSAATLDLYILGLPTA